MDLKPYEKVGFSAKHRENKEKNIFPDIINKLNLKKKKIVLDIGCGCSQPTYDLINFVSAIKGHAVLVDSAEMLNNIVVEDTQKEKFFTKIPCKFPECYQEIKNAFPDGFDAINVYSVLQIIVNTNIIFFIDRATELLKKGGELLLGDIPNETKKRRFLNSDFGKSFHKKWAGDEPPTIKPFEKVNYFDDSLILQILLRYRLMGYETYLLPQKENLPLCYTREDILIKK